MEADCQCMTDDKFSTLEMIFAADYVICDYSAIVFEAALAGKPLFSMLSIIKNMELTEILYRLSGGDAGDHLAGCL